MNQAMNTKLESVSQTRSVHWDISEAVVSFHQAIGKYMLKPMFHQVLWVIMGLSPKF